VYQAPRHYLPHCPAKHLKVPKPTTGKGGTQCTAPSKLYHHTMGTRADHCLERDKKAMVVSLIHDILPLDHCAGAERRVWWAKGTPKCPNVGLARCPAFSPVHHSASQDQLMGQNTGTENGRSIKEQEKPKRVDEKELSS
jgi:hypothetical protein